MNEQSVKNLVFLEFVDEAEKFLERYGESVRNDAASFAIISFHPKVKAYLKSKSIEAHDSYPYCPTRSHQRLLDQLQVWTDELRQGCTLGDAQSVRQSYRENLIFFMRPIMSTWLHRIEVTRNAINSLKPETVICCGEAQMGTVQSPWTESCERYLAEILRQQDQQLGFRLVRIDHRLSGERSEFNRRRSLKQVAASAVGFLGKFMQPRGNLILAPREDYSLAVVLKDLRETYPNDDIAVLYKPAKNLVKNFTESLKGRGFPFRYLFVNPDARGRISSDFQDQMRRWRDTFFDMVTGWEYAGVKPGAWLQQKYTVALEPEIILKTHFQSGNLDLFLNKWRPRFIVAQHARGVTAVLGELAREKKIPSLMIPHGSFTASADRYAAMEWKENALGMVDTPYQYLALQTPMIEQYVHGQDLYSRPVVTGPLILGRVAVQRSKNAPLRKRFVQRNEKIILHAGTPKGRSNQRLLNYETIDEYVAGIESLINATAGIEGIHVIIRYREFDGFTQQMLEGMLPRTQNYSVASDGSFADYLSIADLLVSYSSTTMEEALQNEIPVLVYNRFDRYQHLKGVTLSKQAAPTQPAAVYNVNNEEDLPFALRWILEHHLNGSANWDHLFTGYRYAAGQIVRLADILEGNVMESVAQ